MMRKTERNNRKRDEIFRQWCNHVELCCWGCEQGLNELNKSCIRSKSSRCLWNVLIKNWTRKDVKWLKIVVRIFKEVKGKWDYSHQGVRVGSRLVGLATLFKFFRALKTHKFEIPSKALTTTLLDLNSCVSVFASILLHEASATRCVCELSTLQFKNSSSPFELRRYVCVMYNLTGLVGNGYLEHILLHKLWHRQIK